MRGSLIGTLVPRATIVSSVLAALACTGPQRVSPALSRGSSPNAPTATAASDHFRGPPSEVEARLFEQLARDIGDARVVALGEHSHFAGATADIKLKLIEFLHRELGFKRIVIEAGLFTCAAADDGASPLAVAELCLAGKDPCRSRSYPVFEYAEWARQHGPQLALSGMDPQLSGSAAAKERLLSRLPAALGEPLGDSQRGAIRNLFSLDLVRTLEQRTSDRDSLLELSGRVRQKLGVESFWARVMDGLVFIDEDHWDYQAKQKITIEMVSLRNREMGRNILWLLDQYPDQKTILSLASVHAARTHAGFCNESLPRYLWRENSVPAGQWLAEALGKSYFAVGITAASGEIAAAEPAVGPATPGMIEYGALSRQVPVELLGKQALRERGAAQGLAMGGPGRMDWGQAFDALVVLREERPLDLPGCAP
jgi:erythromycin esterase